MSSKMRFLRAVKAEFDRAEDMRGGQGHPDTQHLGRKATAAVRAAVLKILDDLPTRHFVNQHVDKAMNLLTDFEMEDRVAITDEDDH